MTKPARPISKFWISGVAAGAMLLSATRGFADSPADSSDVPPPPTQQKEAAPPAQPAPKTDGVPPAESKPIIPLAPAQQSDPPAAPDAFAQQASWAPPTVAAVRQQAFDWLEARKPDDATRHAVQALWPADEEQLSGEALLVRVAATFVVADPAAKELIALCRRGRTEFAAPEFAMLTAEATPLFERANLRLLYGRWLAHERMFDEALAQLDGLKAEEVVDPAGLLFYQGVACHHLLKQDPAAMALKQLLERTDGVPRRYTSVARLMLADLKGLEEESLDHIARRMQDIERRLDLGRAGPKVRDVEDGVIRSLDKMIEEMEKQQQAAAAAGGAGPGGTRWSSPAPDSRILGGKGPGQVDKKNLGQGSGWGDLPPKQRQEALQQIGKDYPAHYRDLIEQYFRKLASEDEPIEP